MVLAEDAARDTEFRGERGGGGDMGSVLASLHQITSRSPLRAPSLRKMLPLTLGMPSLVSIVMLKMHICAVKFSSSHTLLHYSKP